MNYLAHLHLGGPDPADMLGSLYGDFVKGPLQGRWPAQIEAGIRLHRQIDAFTDSHPLVLEAKARFPSERRRYAGILLDLFFDHCLAAHWSDYSGEPLDLFTQRAYRALIEEPELPGKLAVIAPHMATHDWLGSYRDFEVLGTVLANMSHRLSRPDGLAGGLGELEQLYDPLLEDFRLFYPQLQRFAKSAM
ncbi:ACP phosphodiesterase [Pseudomonas stutzeri]|uniref:ACP phosphodiesterase n=1 Tax=Stutzerimonas stutzeri TaxID=316 RepID=A0A2N8S1Y7_STUST|nr:ACP phosphodiesterase [Stutzerimonas stutzeri]MCQ4295804.1 ACP phosphodiesterase [Stutzerimonas stutzeri]PNF80641.1 ACP phosphodiesterase [Stutzerimonas stutzeri]